MPLLKDMGLPESLAKAKFHGDMARGVVKTRAAFGVRVAAGDFDKAVSALRPQDAATLLGKLYHVSGLPFGCGKEALTRFFHDWPIAPVFTFKQGKTRTWAVRAVTAPFNTVIQHDDGLVVIKEAPPRTTRPAATSKWSKPAGSTAAPAFPASWAEVAAGTQSHGRSSKQGATQSQRIGGDAAPAPPKQAPAPAASAAAGVAAAPSNPEGTMMAAMGKIEELLASFRRLEGRVDSIASDMAEFRGENVSEDVELIDANEPREQGRTGESGEQATDRASRSPRGRKTLRIR